MSDSWIMPALMGVCALACDWINFYANRSRSIFMPMWPETICNIMLVIVSRTRKALQDKHNSRYHHAAGMLQFGTNRQEVHLIASIPARQEFFFSVEKTPPTHLERTHRGHRYPHAPISLPLLDHHTITHSHTSIH